jgi:hypothetical protein
MVKISFEMKKRDVVWVSLVVFVLGVGVVFTIGGNNPAVMGHSGGEINATDDLCIQITGHACGVDNIGGDSPAGTLCGHHQTAGSYAEAYIIQCQEHDPETSCPSGYTQKTWTHNVYDFIFTHYTCVKN